MITSEYTRWRPHWMVVGIPVAMLLATLSPQLAGKLHWQESARSGSVFYVFLSTGSRIKDWDNFWEDKTTVFLIQAYTFIIVPAFYKLLTSLLSYCGANKDVLIGLMYCACLPPSCAVSVALAPPQRESRAAAAAALSALLAPVASPVLLLATCGITTLESLSRLPTRSFACVLLPLALGRILAAPLANILNFRHKLLAEVIVLLLMYGATCDTIIEMQGELDAKAVLVSVAIVMFTTCLSTAMVSFTGGCSYLPLLYMNKDYSSNEMTRLETLFDGGPFLCLPLLIQRPLRLLLVVSLYTFKQRKRNR